ncbi:MAG: radical SAM protein [Deltaproteobacteria bacterium]|nr:radical SAM protein [Deltaproteobacteria bacterium]
MRARDYAALVAGAARVETARRLGRPTLPYKLELIVTFSCGSRCRTCSIWKRYIDDPDKRADELSVDDWVRAVHSARSHVRWLSLTGGEITEREDLPELVRALVAAVGDRLALIQFTTNGIDPERTESRFADILPATRGIPTYVTMSLDGIGKTYERVRGVPDGHAKVKRSMAALERLGQEHPQLTTSYQVTLSALNVHEADALFEEASRGKERPIITMATNALTLTGGRADVDVRKAGPEVEDALARMWRRYPRRSLQDLPPRLHLGLTRRFFATGEAPLPCAAGHATLTIDPYGGVLQCDSRDRPLARLQDHDFDIPAMCRSASFRQALAPLSGCRECWTPCQAYPTLMHHPAGALASYARAALGR